MDDNKVVTLSAFNANYVLGHFGVTAENDAAADSMRYVYRRVYDDLTHLPAKAARAKMAVEHAIEKIESRYRILAEHGADFFRDTPGYHRDAVLMATICDNFVHDANAPVTEPTEGPDAANCNDDPAAPAFHDDGLDNITLHYACILFDEALELQTHGTLDEDEQDGSNLFLDREIYFIAHLNFLQQVQDAHHALEDLEPEDIEHLMERDFPAAQEFIDVTTTLGLLIHSHMEAIRTHLRPPVAAPVPARSNTLRLVTPEGP